MNNKFKVKDGVFITVDFDKVDCYRGQTLPNGNEGTMVYFEDGSEILLDTPFADVLAVDRKNTTQNA